MTADVTFDAARKVADAVLYEGYVLYPYRASAQKNQLRWQFGVLVPPAYTSVDPSEASSLRTECLLETPSDADVHVLVRFLQVQRRSVDAVDADAGLRAADVVDVDGLPLVPWDEAVDQEVLAVVPLSTMLESQHEVPFQIEPDEKIELVRDDGVVTAIVSRVRERLDGVIRLSAEPLPGPYGVLRLRVEVANSWSGPQPSNRDEALAHSLVAAHIVLVVPGGWFLSMTDPPEWAAEYAEDCRNIGTWPVLVGPADRSDTLLSSPIILGDRPELAPESAGELYDGTEIDEILTLRTMALSDAERLEVRGTDERAAALLDRVDALPGELLERLHGSIRYLRSVTGEPDGPVELGVPGAMEGQPWWDPGADDSVSPTTDEVVVAGVALTRGSRVRLQPGRRRADAQDMFLSGRPATVEAVLLDVDGRTHLAVTLDDDAGADLQRSEGRFLYFSPDEVLPVESTR